MLEGNEVTAKTQLHLDRCLSCRNCESTCPSGVQYHNLLDIGRAVVDAAVPRPLAQRVLRESLRAVVPHAGLFKSLTQVGQVFRPLVPASLKSKLPRTFSAIKPRPAPRHARRVLMLEGCVQPGLAPNTNAATARVLDRLGISVTPTHEAG
ncbi:glycolate oxidase iron-sulfur subunit [compost metagenome]